MSERPHIQRDPSGVPYIRAGDREGLCFGIGQAHAQDRLVQMLLGRAVGEGRVSECFSATDALIDLDRYMRFVDLGKDIDSELGKLKNDVARELDAYCAGVNEFIEGRRRPVELVMVGHRPEPWTPRDSVLTAKVMGYVGLAQTQGEIESFILHMVRHGVPDERIKALFPGITDRIDRDLVDQIQGVPGPGLPELWNRVLPDVRSSNNWVVSGARTAGGHPILASDPHMQVNRLPPLWYEMVWDLARERLMGITMPGLPVLVMGRSAHLAWGGTYAFMDMIDHFVEECRGERFLYDGSWRPLEKRVETIRPRKRPPITVTFFENHHGVLQQAPASGGRYLAMRFSARSGVGASLFNDLMHIDACRTVQEARRLFRELPAPCFNWLFADRAGNIGYQMNGRMPKRPAGVSGLLPVPGWIPECDWQGFEDPRDLPSCYNPESGFFATANNDLNRFGRVHPINVAMAPYRVERIVDMLRQNDAVDSGYVKTMQYDLYSRQAERLMSVIRPLLPDTPNGRALGNWDLSYSSDSVGAFLFESTYRSLIRTVFGTHGIGEALMDHVLEHTGVFTIAHGNFDDVLMDADSPWFREVPRTRQFRGAIDRGLDVPARPHGETARFDMLNIFFQGRLPGWLGFDRRNRALAGSRATIPQGQAFSCLGQRIVFAPSYRMIADLGTDTLETNIAGGPSGRRFSRWYTSDLGNWESGRYKTLGPGG